MHPPDLFRAFLCAFPSLRVSTRNTFGVIMRHLCGRGHATYYRLSTHSSTRGELGGRGLRALQSRSQTVWPGAGTCSVWDSLGACVESFKFTHAHLQPLSIT